MASTITWTDQRWEEEVKIVQEWLNTAGSSISPETKAIVEACIKSGSNQPGISRFLLLHVVKKAARRGRSVDQLRLELSDVRGSPYFEGDETDGVDDVDNKSEGPGQQQAREPVVIDDDDSSAGLSFASMFAHTKCSLY